MRTRQTRPAAVSLIAAGAALVLLSGCAGEPASAEGTWGAEGDGKPQLVLEAGGELSGTDGCNRLMGAWTQADATTIDFGEVASTMMACEGVDTWLVELSTAKLDGDVLRILDSSGAEIGTLARTSGE